MAADDSQGTVLAAWGDKEKFGAKTSILTAIRPPGGAFGPAVALSPSGKDAYGPAVAFDASGDAIVAWVREGTIEAAIRPAGGSFGAAVELSVEGEGAYNPRAIFDSQGDAVVVWTSTSGTPPNFNYKLEANIRPSGGSFGIPHALDSEKTTSNEQHFNFFAAPLAADARGDVFAAWSTSLEQTSGIEVKWQTSIREATSHAGSLFPAPTTLAEKKGAGPSADRVHDPSIAADPQGDALAAWDHYSSTGQRIEAKLGSSEGIFEAEPEIVSGSETNTSSPRVALAGNGDATVVYSAPVGGKTGVVAALRPAGGGFGSPQPISESGVLSFEPVVAALANGETLVAWQRYEKPSRIEGATRPPGGSFGAPQVVSPTGETANVNGLGLVASPSGDAVATWKRNFIAEVAGYDGAGPLLQGLTIPGQGTVGQPLTFSVSPLDAWSALGATSWDFGDGTGASGTSATHTYASPGTFTVTVSSADVLGNLTSSSAAVSVTVAPARGGTAGTTLGTVAPTITGVSQSHAAWRRGGRLARFARSRKTPVGTTFKFTLDQQAQVALAFTSPASGRRVKGKCVATTRRNRHKQACKRTVTRGTLAFSGHGGENEVDFQGRLSRKKRLTPGRYTLVITAANSSGQRSKPKRLHFRIVR